jgi:hypothetical protein
LPSPAVRAKAKARLDISPAICTGTGGKTAVDRTQVFIFDIRDLAFFILPGIDGIKIINTAAASRLYIILCIPSEDWNEKYMETGIDFKNFQAGQGMARRTDNIIMSTD